MEPNVSVGIMSRGTVTFVLQSGFRCLEQECAGEYRVSCSNGRIVWNELMYGELMFEPSADDSSFILKDVTIGVNFHWERREDQEFQGALKFIVAGGKLTVINILPVEKYLTSVIASEMSAKASPELLKAHAVISRSWLLAQIEKNREIVARNERYTAFAETAGERIRWYDREDHTLFDVCADDHCQRYQGVTRASTNMEAVKQAMRATHGEVLLSDDKICDARFSKCCGGVTEEFQNCWEDNHFSYLRKLRDDADTTDLPDLRIEAEALKWIKSSPAAFCNTKDKAVLEQVLNNYDRETGDFYRWSVAYSQAGLSDLIRERSGIDFGTVESLIPVERGTSGRLVRLKIAGTKRTMTIGKELEIRRILSKSHLYSSAFVVERRGGDFRLYGAGWGHGVGLCQIGAAVMSGKGYDYRQILLHYYAGAEVKKAY